MPTALRRFAALVAKHPPVRFTSTFSGSASDSCTSGARALLAVWALFHLHKCCSRGAQGVVSLAGRAVCNAVADGGQALNALVPSFGEPEQLLVAAFERAEQDREAAARRATQHALEQVETYSFSSTTNQSFVLTRYKIRPGGTYERFSCAKVKRSIPHAVAAFGRCKVRVLPVLLHSSCSLCAQSTVYSQRS